MARTQAQPQVVVLGLAGCLVLSALYDVIPNHWFDDEFEHLRLPRWFRTLFVLAKTAAVTGLLVGFRSPRLGRLTAHALVAYFVLAVGAHVRVKDDSVRHVPAITMLAWSALLARSYPKAPKSSV